MGNKFRLSRGGAKEWYGIIPARAEGADMPTGKTKSRCAWEAVNAPAIRCLRAMCRGCGV